MSKHDFSKEDINSRKSTGREQRNPEELKIVELSAIQNRFDDAMRDIKGLADIYTKISSESDMNDEDKNSLQELLRSQILLMESALDLYMHEISKYGISKIFNNAPHWNETFTFREFKVTLGNLKDVYYGQKRARDMANLIANILQYSSFMKFEAIIQQLIMMGIIIDENNIPSEIETFRLVITDLCDRRNIIAHASDRDFKKDFLGRKQGIEESEVQYFYDELRKFQGVIHKYVINKK